MNPCTISPPLGGKVSVWGANGRQIWKTPNGELLAELLGCQPWRIPSHSTDVCHDIAEVSIDGTMMRIWWPAHAPDTSGPFSHEDMTFGFAEFDGVFASDHVEAATATEWENFGQWLGGVLQAAVSRGDQLLLEHHDPLSGATSTATAVVRLDGYEPYVQLTSLPAVPNWPAGSRYFHSEQLSWDALTTAVEMLKRAAIHWAESPLDLQITFLPRQGVGVYIG
jgi:hypothetical protein